MFRAGFVYNDGMSASEKNKQDLKNSFTLLETHIGTYEAGNFLTYQPMAVELRKLLCETNPSPLINRIIPDFKLHKLHFVKILENTPSLLNGLQNVMPGRLEVINETIPIFTLLFSKEMEEMSVDEWVDQILFKEQITIRELIRSVANKEGAHSDKNYNDTLLHCRSWSFNETESHILGIYAISKYVLAVFKKEFEASL
tara:strand:+ start:171 stop:767 length:597 start_codon:yes stop_codon:yes gene_type:complete